VKLGLSIATSLSALRTPRVNLHRISVAKSPCSTAKFGPQEHAPMPALRRPLNRSRLHAPCRRPCMGVRPSAATGRSARRERLQRGLRADGLAAAKAHQLPPTYDLKSEGSLLRISARCVRLSMGVRPAAATGRVVLRERLRESTSSKGCSNSQASGRLSFSRSFCITGRSYGLPSASAQLQR
jgi:hypothetical protein